jgi:mRNA-degrading endonuclease RelE of RelBE toxin-antitoxin system
MAYKVEFAATARKQFDKLPDDARCRLAQAIDKLGENPRQPRTLKLSAEDGSYTLPALGITASWTASRTPDCWCS